MLTAHLASRPCPITHADLPVADRRPSTKSPPSLTQVLSTLNHASYDRVENDISELETSIAGPYAGTRPGLAPITGTIGSEIYPGTLSGLEPGSLAGSFYFNGQVHQSWPVRGCPPYTGYV
jgi:hypothetical protein